MWITGRTWELDSPISHKDRLMMSQIENQIEEVHMFSFLLTAVLHNDLDQVANSC